MDVPCFKSAEVETILLKATVAAADRVQKPHAAKTAPTDTVSAAQTTKKPGPGTLDCEPVGPIPNSDLD
jgi:hypothetical protein